MINRPLGVEVKDKKGSNRTKKTQAEGYGEVSTAKIEGKTSSYHNSRR